MNICILKNFYNICIFWILAINLVDGPQTLEILRQIETHFGKPIQKLDAEDVDEIEKIQKN